MLIIQMKPDTETGVINPENFWPWLEKACAQLGDAFEYLGELWYDFCVAEIKLHPNASKYAMTVIEASGFVVIKS